MSETKHTEGRLVVDFENTYKDNGERHYMVGVPDSDIIVALTGKVGAGDDEESKANASRIAACWNACVGIHNEVLEAPGYSIKAVLDNLDAQIEGRLKAERERDALRARLAALEELATAVEADIDCGRPLEYNVEDLRVELIRARAALGIPPEQKVIAFSCGFCGAPLNANKEQVDAPEGYDPNAYPHDACGRCQAERNEPRYVTREMAIDAGDPNLEGTQW